MKEISLTQGKVAFVDDEDYEWVSKYKWHFASGYAAQKVSHPAFPNRKLTQKMHRIIMGLYFGDKREVDHIDGDRLNNCRSNLRVCTHSENLKNRKHHINSSSQLKGASKHGNRWHASITVDGIRRHLGAFATAEEAHSAYRDAAIKLHGAFARFE